MKNRIVSALCGVAAIAATAALAATHFPNRPVRLLLPLAPRGGGDMVARMLAEPLSKR